MLDVIWDVLVKLWGELLVQTIFNININNTNILIFNINMFDILYSKRQEVRAQ